MKGLHEIECWGRIYGFSLLDYVDAYRDLIEDYLNGSI
jgi:hypothetical protein